MDKRLLDEIEPPRRGRGLDNTGNRIALAVVIGIGTNALVVAGGVRWSNPVGPLLLTTLVATVFYVVITLLRGGR